MKKVWPRKGVILPPHTPKKVWNGCDKVAAIDFCTWFTEYGIPVTRRYKTTSLRRHDVIYHNGRDFKKMKRKLLTLLVVFPTKYVWSNLPGNAIEYSAGHFCQGRVLLYVNEFVKWVHRQIECDFINQPKSSQNHLKITKNHLEITPNF